MLAELAGLRHAPPASGYYFSRTIKRAKTLSLTTSLLPPASDTCLLYTSDAADDLLCVDLGGRRITIEYAPPVSALGPQANSDLPRCYSFRAETGKPNGW